MNMHDIDEKAQSSYVYVDAGVQALLLLTFFSNLFSAGLDVPEDVFWGSSVTWITALFVWQIFNALVSKYYHEEDIFDKYLRYAMYMLIGIGSFFGLVGMLSIFELISNIFLFILALWAYVLWIALYAHLVFYVFVGWYIYLTAWRISNRWNNQAY